MADNRGRSKAEKAKAKKAADIKNYARGFATDSEEVATAYKNFKSPKDPDINKIQSGLEKGDKSARAAVERANEIGDSLVYNPKKDPNFRSIKEDGMKKGGAVRSKASSRADGCAVRGKTRA